MIAKGWNNGNPDDKSGAGYGISLMKKDRDTYFKKSWTSISIDLEGSESVGVKLSKTFWADCIEVRSSKIGRWLFGKGLAPWKKNHPPILSLEQIIGKKFYLSFNPNYEKEYSEKSFWDKLSKYALKAGREVVFNVLTLYFCMLDKDTPYKARAVIIGALGYFITPFDAILDFTPGVGYADDFGVLAIAVATVTVHIKPEHRKKAEEILEKWFG